MTSYHPSNLPDGQIFKLKTALDCAMFIVGWHTDLRWWHMH